MQSESEKQNAKWLLQQRLRKRLRKAGCEDPNDLEDQLVASEKAILDCKLESQKEKDEMINSNNQQYNSDYKLMVKSELEGASIDTQAGFWIYKSGRSFKRQLSILNIGYFFGYNLKTMQRVLITSMTS